MRTRRMQLLALSLSAGFWAFGAAVAHAAPGGGSGGFGGGGGRGGGGGGGFRGGGGGFGGGGGGYVVGGGGGGLLWIIVLVVLVVLVAMAAAAFARWKIVRRRRARAAQVEILAEEAATDDPAFAPEAVKAGTLELHRDIVAAWNADDRDRLRTLVSHALFVEWNRRLQDFQRRGWKNTTEVLHTPDIQYIGLVNRAADAEDRVVVHIQARLRDVVVDRFGAVIARSDDPNSDGLVTLAEYWTLAKRDGRWILASIEQDAEGLHNLDAAIVASPWSDDRLRDEAMTEQATATALPEEQIREVADVDFDGSARTAAMDLANVDGRFAPDVLEAAARRALAGWAEAVDGDDDALAAIATPEAVTALLHPGDPSGRTRLVVRGPRLRALRIVAVDGAAHPPFMTVEAEVSGRRYIENRDTTTVLSGNKEREVVFIERWRMVLNGDATTPWRITPEETAAIGGS